MGENEEKGRAINLYVPSEVAEIIQRRAEQQERSFSAQVRFILADTAKRYEMEEAQK